MKIAAIGDGDFMANFMKDAINRRLRDENIQMHRIPAGPIDVSDSVCFICQHGIAITRQLIDEPYVIWDFIRENIRTLRQKCYECGREYRRMYFRRHPLDPAYDPEVDK